MSEIFTAAVAVTTQILSIRAGYPDDAPRSLNYIMQYDARGAIGLKCVVYNDASTLCY